MNLDELNSKLKKMIADNNAAQFGFRSGFETQKASGRRLRCIRMFNRFRESIRHSLSHKLLQILLK